MKHGLKGESEYLLLFFLIWVSINLWVISAFPQLKDFDISGFSSGNLWYIFVLSLVSLYAFVMSAVYVNRIQKKIRIGGLQPSTLTLIYVLSVVLLGLLALFLVIFILWKAKKQNLPKEKTQDY